LTCIDGIDPCTNRFSHVSARIKNRYQDSGGSRGKLHARLTKPVIYDHRLYDHGGPSKNLHIDPEYALDQFQTHNLYDIVFLCNFDILNQPDHISEDKSESGPDDSYVQCQDCSLDEHIRRFIGQKNHPFE